VHAKERKLSLMSKSTESVSFFTAVPDKTALLLLKTRKISTGNKGVSLPLPPHPQSHEKVNYFLLILIVFQKGIQQLITFPGIKWKSESIKSSEISLC
jgi:hypothetical protein